MELNKFDFQKIDESDERLFIDDEVSLFRNCKSFPFFRRNYIRDALKNATKRAKEAYNKLILNELK